MLNSAEIGARLPPVSSIVTSFATPAIKAADALTSSSGESSSISQLRSAECYCCVVGVPRSKAPASGQLGRTN